TRAGGYLVPAVLRLEEECRAPVRGAAANRGGGHVQLAVLLPRLAAGQTPPESRIRRRRHESRRLRQISSAGRRLPRSLGARRAAFLLGIAIPGAVSRRRVHRVSGILESRAGTGGRLQGRLPAP